MKGKPMQRAALVTDDGIVENVVIVDPEAEWEPPEGLELVELPDDSPVGPGWTGDGKEWIEPKGEEEDDREVPDPLADLIEKKNAGKSLTAAEKQRARDALLDELLEQRLGG
jgi:hypothetical protein